jgi:SAM-dependent methyltransferase
MSVETAVTGDLLPEGADREDKLALPCLGPLMQRPEVYAPGVEQFWTDPHIAKSMLKAHLDPTHDAASRRPKMIDRTVGWLVDHLGLAPGTRLLDLGCGPGLYAQRLARRGVAVTGVDFSANSLAYARAEAAEAELPIKYLCQDYRHLAFKSDFDVAMMIYYDLGALSGQDRGIVLDRVYQALRPGGRFVFDVLTCEGRRRARRKPGWQVSQGGFWRPGPHLVLTDVHRYPEDRAELDQYIVIDESGRYAVYRVWSSYFDAAAVESLVTAHGFVLEGLWSDLMGSPLTTGASNQGLGVVARRPSYSDRSMPKM